MTKSAQNRLFLSTRTVDIAAPVTSDTPMLSGMCKFATPRATLGGAERKLIGVVLSELQPAAVNCERDNQHA
jgi:hypothetical protein